MFFDPRHALLSQDLLDIKRPLERGKDDPVIQPAEVTTEDVIDAFGSLFVARDIEPMLLLKRRYFQKCQGSKPVRLPWSSRNCMGNRQCMNPVELMLTVEDCSLS
jgi:hypothetical protein